MEERPKTRAALCCFGRGDLEDLVIELLDDVLVEHGDEISDDKTLRVLRSRGVSARVQDERILMYYRDMDDAKLIDTIVQQVQRGEVVAGRCDAGMSMFSRLILLRQELEKFKELGYELYKEHRGMRMEGDWEELMERARKTFKEEGLEVEF